MESNEQIQDFCRRYFQAVDAPILIDQPDFLQVELPRDIDKELTDRPFYWMYVEATGQNPANSVLSLSFAPGVEMEGVERIEFVTLGSFRLNKIIESVQKRGRFTRAYQTGAGTAGRALSPYLLATFKLSFVADRRRDEMVSYAVDLRSGQVFREAYGEIERLTLTDAPARTVTTSSPSLSLSEGYHIIRQAVEGDISALDHTWAEEANEHLAREREQLETYYESLCLVNADENKTDGEKEKKAAMYAAERELRIAELEWRCAPRIAIAPFHFGLLYLADGVLTGTAATGNRLST
ncbi:hypothetical protein OS242_15945 [Tumebacillus sp. DT12]|uniref:Uncharacterized protein n=1 Tax=Tumebacillus lacus TaxID=2995335 RepID=A0ABT3X3H0_9BACL|nr:YqhG family protein [Tumebacillus lacus]MCX7571443.1 hypothetical protein [Tumebacillus lacus]